MKVGIAFDMCEAAEKLWGSEKYKKIKECGYGAVDFSMSETESGLYSCSEEEFEKKLLREKKLAEESGITISQVHGPWRWPPRDFTAEDRAERMEKMKKSIYGTSVLGCENWVVHPIMPYGVEEIGTEHEKDTWGMNVEFMSELLKTAKKYGVTICFENMPMHKFSLATPEKILEFVKQINDDNFKICLDTGHVSVFPDLSVGDEVRKLGKYIKVFHIHDNRCEFDLHLIPKFGIIDWDDFAKSLKDINYDGVFSLETLPPKSLSADLFEKYCILMFETAKEICGS